MAEDGVTELEPKDWSSTAKRTCFIMSVLDLLFFLLSGFSLAHEQDAWGRLFFPMGMVGVIFGVFSFVIWNIISMLSFTIKEIVEPVAEKDVWKQAVAISVGMSLVIHAAFFIVSSILGFFFLILFFYNLVLFVSIYTFLMVQKAKKLEKDNG